jgi:hypothetical protein
VVLVAGIAVMAVTRGQGASSTQPEKEGQ